MIAIAVATKLIGCRSPSMIFLKDKAKAVGVEVGTVSRGEGVLIIAGVGVSSGAPTADIYTIVISWWL